MEELQTTAIKTRLSRIPRFAWIALLIVDVGFIAWGAMAALAPEHLMGPHSMPIIQAEYEGFTGNSWAEFTATSPKVADLITIVFRVYGAYNVAFGVLSVAIILTAFRRGERWAWWALLLGNTITLGSAIIFDRAMNAIGIFEMSEYLGLVLVYVALIITVPFLAVRRSA